MSLFIAYIKRFFGYFFLIVIADFITNFFELTDIVDLIAKAVLVSLFIGFFSWLKSRYENQKTNSD